MHHITFDDSYPDGLDIVALATKRKDAKEVKTDGGKVITIKIPKNFSEVLADPDNKEGWFLWRWTLSMMPTCKTAHGY